MKLNHLLGVFVLAQFAYIVAVQYGWYTSTSMPFDLLHEDTILVIHVMTWFVVRAIENLGDKL